MYRWYSNAHECIVYLADVIEHPDVPSLDGDFRFYDSFERSTWFARGWTLQELLAPRVSRRQ